MFFSLILPLYNKEKYIDFCLDSITGQTFSDFEVVVIDDGSTDEGGRMVKNRALIDGRISLHRFSNGGVSKARNRGIERSSGNYLLFIDADDLIEPDYLQQIHDHILRYKSELVFFGLTKREANGIEESIYPPFTGVLNDKQPFFNSFLSEQLSNGIYGYIANKAVDRDFIQKHHLRFDTGKRHLEDFDFWISVLKHNPSISFLPYSGYYYIKGTENSSFAAAKVSYVQLIDVFRNVDSLLKGQSGSVHNQEIIARSVAGFVRSHLLELPNVCFAEINRFLRNILSDRFIQETIRQNDHQQFIDRWIMGNHAWRLFLYLSARKAGKRILTSIR